MNKTLLGAVSVLALVAAGNAFGAGGNVRQGSPSAPVVGDTAVLNCGATDSCTITQNSDSNTAIENADNSQNTATIVQDTDGIFTGNYAVSTQNGTEGTVDIKQMGENGASVLQDTNSQGETAYIRQVGYNNNNTNTVTTVNNVSTTTFTGAANIYQNGTSNSGWILQNGHDNVSTVRQTGFADLFSYPSAVYTGASGPNASAAPSPSSGEKTIAGETSNTDFGSRIGGGSQQVGDQNYSNIVQEGATTQSFASNEATGNDNDQAITQDPGVNRATAFFKTKGDDNNDNVTQVAGAAYSGASQWGLNNSITVNQNGASTSLIGQGTQVDRNGVGSLADGPQVYDTSANIDQLQTEFSRVEQYANNSSVTVNQNSGGSNNNESHISQAVGATESSVRIDQYGVGGYSNVAQLGTTGGYDSAFVEQDTASNGTNSFLTQAAYHDTAHVRQNGFSAQSMLNQAGAADDATIDQYALNSNQFDVSTVNQTNKGGHDSVTVTQNAFTYTSTPAHPVTSDRSTVNQSSGEETATVEQDNAFDISNVSQVGMHDGATVTQSSTNDSSTANQSGNVANLTLTQSADSDSSTVTQSGKADTATITQEAANDSSTVTQTLSGLYDTVTITQEAANDKSTVTQSGTQDTFILDQKTANDTSTFKQTGTNDYYNLTQSSAPGLVFNSQQTGNNLHITATQ